MSDHQSSYAKRRIDITYRLGQGNFGQDGYDETKLTGLRCTALIEKAGAASMGGAELRILGMTLDLMNKLNQLGGIPLAVRANNVVIVEAGTAQKMSVVFQGTIMNAWSTFIQPNGLFQVSAFNGIYDAVKPDPPLSYSGPTDANTVFSFLAQRLGLVFETSVKSAVVDSPYFPGTRYQQAQDARDAYGIEMFMDDDTLAIWPRGGTRPHTEVIISTSTGMVNYPTKTQTGIQLQTQFNPNLVFGAKVKVESDITVANGIWQIVSLRHELESETPDGSWFSYINCVPVGAI